jgi:hypothetical protein
MFEQITENRPSAVAALWLLHVRPTGASTRRSKEKPLAGGQASHRRQRWRNLVVSLRVIGERLARCRLSFTDYPWDRGD